MNLKSFYEEGLEFAQRIVSFQAPQEGERLVARLGSPEVVLDSIPRSLVAFSYHYATSFSDRGRPIVAEVAGIIPEDQVRKNRLMVVSPNSLAIIRAIYQSMNGNDPNNPQIVERFVREFGVTAYEQKGATVVSSGPLYFDADFCTKPGARLEDLIMGTSLRFLGSLLTGNPSPRKSLPNEQYLFSVPLNHALLNGLKNTAPENRRPTLVKNKEYLVPGNQIAGVHFIYSPGHFEFRPVITEADANLWKDELTKRKLKTKPVGITHFGIQSEDGTAHVAESWL